MCIRDRVNLLRLGSHLLSAVPPRPLPSDPRRSHRLLARQRSLLPLVHHLRSALRLPHQHSVSHRRLDRQLHRPPLERQLHRLLLDRVRSHRRSRPQPSPWPLVSHQRLGSRQRLGSHPLLASPRHLGSRPLSAPWHRRPRREAHPSHPPLAHRPPQARHRCRHRLLVRPPLSGRHLRRPLCPHPHRRPSLRRTPTSLMTSASVSYTHLTLPTILLV
mgnify:CR=1 FL=1